MNRAQLNPEEVTRIIITASMTPITQPVDVKSELSSRKAEGFLDVGWHWLITLDGATHAGVPVEQRGSYFSRYAKSSVVIKIAGGSSSNGEPLNTFVPQQLDALGQLLAELSELYPNATPTLHRELFRGVNPVFEHEDY